MGVHPTTKVPLEDIPGGSSTLGRGHSSLTLANPVPGLYTLVLQGPLDETFSIQFTWQAGEVDEELELIGVYPGEGISTVRFSLTPGSRPELALAPESAPVREVDARADDSQVRLCWEPTGAEKYRIYGKPSGELDLALVGESSVNCYSPGHPFLLGDQAGEEWLYGVTALNGEHETLISGLVSNRLRSVAEFTADRTTGFAPLRVRFEDASNGLIETWDWDLDGDGQTDDTHRNPEFTYQTPGLYSVGLTVSGPSGSDSVHKPRIIEVKQYEPPPSSLRVSPDPLLVCAPTGLPKVRVAWEVPSDLLVEIRIGAPEGTVFARSRGSGSRDTGNWVTDGMEFFLVDVEAGQVLQRFRVSLRRSCESRIWADPNPVEICDGSAVGSSVIFWEAPVERRVEVRLGSPTGALFATSWGSGRQATGKWVKEGTTFILWEPAAKAELGRVILNLDTGCLQTRIWAEPNPVQVCDGSGLAKVRLSWEVPADMKVEVRITSASGPLFASTRGSGSRETGKWVKDGMTFVLADPRAAKVLETVQVTHTQTGCNRPPVADAGPDLHVSPGSRVFLDGSQSFDPDGDPIGFLWTQLSTTSTDSVQLENAQTSRATFRAPNRPTTLQFQLTVTDGKLSGKDSVVVFVGSSTTSGTAWSAASGRFAGGGNYRFPEAEQIPDQILIHRTGDLALLVQTLVQDPIGMWKFHFERNQIRAQQVDPLLGVLPDVRVTSHLGLDPDDAVLGDIHVDDAGVGLPGVSQRRAGDHPIHAFPTGGQPGCIAGGDG